MVGVRAGDWQDYRRSSAVCCFCISAKRRPWSPFTVRVRAEPVWVCGITSHGCKELDGLVQRLGLCDRRCSSK